MENPKNSLHDQDERRRANLHGGWLWTGALAGLAAAGVYGVTSSGLPWEHDSQVGRNVTTASPSTLAPNPIAPPTSLAKQHKVEAKPIPITTSTIPITTTSTLEATSTTTVPVEIASTTTSTIIPVKPQTSTTTTTIESQSITTLSDVASTTTITTLPPPRAPIQPELRSNKKMYVVGDSILERALEYGLPSVIERAGGTLTANADVSRSIYGGGVTGQTGIAAIEADNIAVKDAGIIVVELGTNPSDTPAGINTVMHTIRTENASSPVYWVNIGALGFEPTSNQDTYMNIYNQENVDLLRASTSSRFGFGILNFCGVVFGGNARNCFINRQNERPGILDTDDVHPSIPYGIVKFNQLLAGVYDTSK